MSKYLVGASLFVAIYSPPAGATGSAHDSAPLVAPKVIFRPEVTTGKSKRFENVEAQAPSGRLRVTFDVDWFAPWVFSDKIAAAYAVCFKSVERNIVYCYKAVEL